MSADETVCGYGVNEETGEEEENGASDRASGWRSKASLLPPSDLRQLCDETPTFPPNS